MVKRVSDDLDHVPTAADSDPLQSSLSSSSKRRKKTAPEPGPIPLFKPLQIEITTGCGNLPPNLTPLQAFESLLSEEILNSIVESTNEYARIESENLRPPQRLPKPWHPITTGELYAFLGIHIWMGLAPLPDRDSYWNTDPQKPLFLAIRKAMSHNRFVQIERYLHLSDPRQKNLSVFSKLQPFSDQLNQQFKKAWTTGTHLAVDECIAKFLGRAVETVNIPSKPTPEGFKIWVLAESGYVLNWMYHVRGSGKDDGPIGLNPKWIKDEGFSRTEGVVLQLATTSDLSNAQKHVIWVDNLFTSCRLLSRLKQFGIAAAGTVRNAPTKRESIEKQCGTAQQKQQMKQQKNQNRGFSSSLLGLKNEFDAQIPWGTLYSDITPDYSDVLQVAWKDQSTVLFMSTFHDGQGQITRRRKRPAATATNAKTSRAVFGNEPTKDLEIPIFIDDYNHHMNGVDQADQLRGTYDIQRSHNKNWKSLWYWLLGTAITNAWILIQSELSSSKMTHKSFRELLAKQLFTKAEMIKNPALAIPIDHQLATIQLHPTKAMRNCKSCTNAKRFAKQTAIRTPLKDLSINANRPVQQQKRRSTYKRSMFQCSICKEPLCKDGPCLDEHKGLQSSGLQTGITVR